MVDSNERLFRKVWAAWPTFLSDSHAAAWKAWTALDAEERVCAADRAADYVAACAAEGSSVCAFGVYLSSRRWTGMAQPEEQPFDEYATPFSKPWCAWIIAHLLTEPGGEGRDWPFVAELYRRASVRLGHRFARRWHDIGAGLVPVPVGSDGWRQWWQEFERRRWPWFPHPGNQPVAFFPPGGPARLEAFEAAIRDEASE